MPDLPTEARQKEALVDGGSRLRAIHHGGRKEDVVVRLLPIRQIAAYRLVADDEAATVELFCGKPAGWSDTLVEESLVEILRAGEDLNLAPLSRYLARQTERQEKLQPGLEDRVLAQVLKTLATSPTGSPTPPSASAKASPR